MDLIQMDINKFMVQLFHKGDPEKILDGSPWLLKNNMIILKKVTVGEHLVVIQMTTAKIWVQVHQHLFGFMDVSIGAFVGSDIGKMVK